MVDFGGSEAGKKGAEARAKKLTPEQRSEIARNAALAKWEKEGSLIPVATHGSPDHPLRIGDVEIPCYVLNDGRRVLVQSGMLAGLDMKQGTAGRGGGDRLAKFINTKAVSPYVPKGLSDVIMEPIKFRTPNGSSAYGYEATVLADMCDAVLDARKKGKLNYQQEHIAARCEMLARGFMRVGIVALVDEATGYQEVRDRDALQEILDKYLRKEFATWAKRFPDEFYQEIFRLRGWVWRGMRINRPSCVASYTKDLVYKRLAPGILKELENRNPIADKGYRLHKHHQLLTEDVGHPALSQHLHALLGLMRASDNWKQMMSLVNRAFPKRGDSLQLDLFNDDQGDDE